MSCLAASAQTPAQAPAKRSAAIPFPSLPAAQPTGIPDPAPPRQSGRPAGTSATVQYKDGRLAVVADNSSLNQILRDISRETGIKITGGVADERVFGTYGPANPARILATLLDGTGSNMLLIDGASAGSRELILTPRTGGVSPSLNGNFGQTNSVDESDLPPEQRGRRGLPGFNPQPLNSTTPAGAAAPAFSSGVPTSAPATPGQATAPDDSPAATAPASAAPAADTTQQQSPNGVKTPQQIYDQLIKLQQQGQPKP